MGGSSSFILHPSSFILSSLIPFFLSPVFQEFTPSITNPHPPGYGFKSPLLAGGRGGVIPEIHPVFADELSGIPILLQNKPPPIQRGLIFPPFHGGN
jgi:hypothetical protein